MSGQRLAYVGEHVPYIVVLRRRAEHWWQRRPADMAYAFGSYDEACGWAASVGPNATVCPVVYSVAAP